ncbi:hypothetical protein [Actinopolymorpha alba]|uniref:hypothetical protein n=1 Tax=Actinopolymorpha alba TaxID=533267 RepID=UPI0003A24826|nr:hypothetical protein [Actinopolymorpha alba]
MTEVSLGVPGGLYQALADWAEWARSAPLATGETTPEETATEASTPGKPRPSGSRRTA